MEAYQNSPGYLRCRLELKIKLNRNVKDYFYSALFRLDATQLKYTGLIKGIGTKINELKALAVNEHETLEFEKITLKHDLVTLE